MDITIRSNGYYYDYLPGKTHSIIDSCLCIVHSLSQVQPTSQETYGIEPKHITGLSSSHTDVLEIELAP